MLSQDVGKKAEDHSCTQSVLPLPSQLPNDLPCFYHVLLVDSDLTAKKISRFRVLHGPHPPPDEHRP